MTIASQKEKTMARKRARKSTRKSTKTAEEVEREKVYAESRSVTTEGTDAHTAGTDVQYAESRSATTEGTDVQTAGTDAHHDAAGTDVLEAETGAHHAGTGAHHAGTGAHHAGTGATLFEKRQTEERNHVEAVEKVVVTAVAGDHESYVAMEISYSQRPTHHICRESVL